MSHILPEAQSRTCFFVIVHLGLSHHLHINLPSKISDFTKPGRPHSPPGISCQLFHISG